MSVSAIFRTRVMAAPHYSLSCGGGSMSIPFPVGTTTTRTSTLGGGGGGGGLLIVCSSRPKKKATAHHIKTRPRKTQPWDIKRKPTVYPPLPPLPADWTLVIPAYDSSPDEAASPPPVPSA